jgi:hypothetical protein
MMQQPHAAGSSETAAQRSPVGWQWWVALVVVTVGLGFLGRGDGGFWGVFLWSIVGFVVGSLVSIAVAGRAETPGSRADGLSGHGAAGTAGGRR